MYFYPEIPEVHIFSLAELGLFFTGILVGLVIGYYFGRKDGNDQGREKLNV